MKRKAMAFIFWSLLACSNRLFAQLPVLPIIRDSIYSTILKEERTLEIVLPADYLPSSNNKPGVIYVIDGEWNTRIVADYNQFLHIQFIPSNIVVGIDAAPKGKENTRFLDLTPGKASDPKFPPTGGGDLFLAFIKNELIPYINKKYPNKTENTIFGASLGGLFGMYAFLKEPQLFNAYLLADPSLFWEKYSLEKMAAERLGSFKGLCKTLVITGRYGKQFHGMGVAGMDSVFKADAPAGIRWKTLSYSDETHNSMIFRTMYDGLKYIYGGWYASNNMGFYPQAGYLLAGKPVKVHCFSDDFSDLRYTTDGSIPVVASEIVPDPPISIAAPATLTIKSFCTQPAYEKVISGTFQLSESFKPMAKPAGITPGGLNYSIYKKVKNVVDSSTAKPVLRGIADSSFTVGKFSGKDTCTAVLDGLFEAKTDGYYLFMLNADTETKLTIAGRTVIERPDGAQSIAVPLLKGFYPLRLIYNHPPGSGLFSLYYADPGNLENGDISPMRLLLLNHH